MKDRVRVRGYVRACVFVSVSAHVKERVRERKMCLSEKKNQKEREGGEKSKNVGHYARMKEQKCGCLDVCVHVFASVCVHVHKRVFCEKER